MTPNTLVRAQSDKVFVAELAGEAVLLNAETGIYFTLNPVGLMIWSSLVSEPRTVEELVAEVVRAFPAASANAPADVSSFVSSLVDHQLAIVISTRQDSPVTGAS
jgi:hypothetical protein